MEYIAAVVATLGLTVALVFTIQGMDRVNLRHACDSFAQQSGFQTKFVDYTAFSYDCLAERSDGKWISTKMLRESDTE